MVAAATLAAVLAVVAGRVLVSAVGDLRRLRSGRGVADPPGGHPAALADTVRVDATMARGMRTSAGGTSLVLAGHNGPVRYDVAEFFGRPTLWRSAAGVREPVWVGASRIDVEVLRRVVVEGEPPGDGDSIGGGLPRVPERFAIGVTDVRGRLIVREVIGD